MEESRYSLFVFDQFDRLFPKDWIASIKNNKDAAASKGLQERANQFCQLMVAQYARMVLAGDQLINGIDTVDRLLNDNRLEGLLSDEPEASNPFDEAITEVTYDLLQDIHNATRLVKYHTETTKRYFENDAETYIVEGIKFNRENTGNPVLIGLLEQICDICDDEYNFSYDKGYIQKLVLGRAQLSNYNSSEFSSEINDIIGATIKKIEFLLFKLALYSEGKSISYNLDFNSQTITLDNYDKGGSDAQFRQLYTYFYNPDSIPDGNAIQWWENQKQSMTSMWRTVYLMRYCCKRTKSIKQIDALVKIGQTHYDNYLKGKTRSKVNDKAEHFFINYLYNSRFSFLCKSPERYDYAAMKNDLEQIKSIQDSTGIHNYHPYQKACDYLIQYITTRLRRTDYVESLKEELDFLQECYSCLKENVDWGTKHHPYLMPFRYKFSKITIEQGKVDIYFPSSISRPLKFKEIEERVREIGNAVQWLGLQIGHQEEKEKIVEAHAEISKTKEKIEGMENANIRHMGYFITVTTFLIGLLSIFVGNQGGVSIYEKMEYVTALGILLLLFVGVGYFALTDHITNRKKYWTLFALGIFAAMALGWESHKGFANLKASRKAQEKEQIVKNQSRSLETKTDTLVIEVNAKVESEGHVVTVTESPKKGNAKAEKK